VEQGAWHVDKPAQDIMLVLLSIDVFEEWTRQRRGFRDEVLLLSCCLWSEGVVAWQVTKSCGCAPRQTQDQNNFCPRRELKM